MSTHKWETIRHKSNHEGVVAPLEPSAREFAQKWILDHQPEPLKCMYCGKAQVLTLGPICSGATWLDTCPNSPTTAHTYQFTFGGEDQRKLDSTAEMLQAYAAAVSKNLQEERDEAISARKHTQDWYARHYGKLQDWARKQLPEPYVNDFFSCIANGTTLGPDGKYFEMPSAYSQLLADQTIRAETAEQKVAELERRKSPR